MQSSQKFLTFLIHYSEGVYSVYHCRFHCFLVDALLLKVQKCKINEKVKMALDSYHLHKRPLASGSFSLLRRYSKMTSTAPITMATITNIPTATPVILITSIWQTSSHSIHKIDY